MREPGGTPPIGLCARTASMAVVALLLLTRTHARTRPTLDRPGCPQLPGPWYARAEHGGTCPGSPAPLARRRRAADGDDVPRSGHDAPCRTGEDSGGGTGSIERRHRTP